MRHPRIAALVAAAACGLALVACDDWSSRPTPKPSGETPAATHITQPGYEVTAEDGACDFALPRRQDPATVRCGTVAVPENREGPGGRRIRLAFALLMRTEGDEAEAPLLVLDGGPGASTLEGLMRNWFSRDFAEPIQRSRDIVFFDYRGTGRSEPDMSCPEFDALGPMAGEAAGREALLACRDRIVTAGVDLDQYHSASLAADAADVMQALGYSRYAVFGVSYGTRVALTMLRDRPLGIESAVLDSVYPPQVDLYAGLVLHQQEALERGLGQCADDAACAAAYPDIVDRMYALVEEATASPIAIDYTDADGAPGSATVDGRRLLGVFIRAVTDTSYLGSLPKLIDEIERGGYGQLRSIVAQQEAGGPAGAIALRTTVLGAEELPFASAEAIEEAAGRVRPEVLGTGINVVDEEELATEQAFNDDWGVAARPEIETEAVSSDVPVLILAGELDPTTPPAWADLAAETLSRAVVVEFRGLGHSVAFQRLTDCPVVVMAGFLSAQDGEVDTRCVEALAGPVWILP